jgi:hypothetical protein
LTLFDKLGSIDLQKCLRLLVLVLLRPIPHFDESIIRATDKDVFFRRVPIQTIEAVNMCIECVQGHMCFPKIPDVNLAILVTCRNYRIPDRIELHIRDDIIRHPHFSQGHRTSWHFNIPQLDCATLRRDELIWHEGVP